MPVPIRDAKQLFDINSTENVMKVRKKNSTAL